MTETDRIYRLKSDIRYRNIADEGIVLRQDEGEVLVVNGVGVRVVELIAEGNALKQILTTLEGEYEVDQEQLLADFKDYIEELENAGVLESSD